MLPLAAHWMQKMNCINTFRILEPAWSMDFQDFFNDIHMSSIKFSSFGLHQTEDHWSHRVVPLCLPLPCFPLLITSKQGFSETTSQLIGSTVCREAEFNLPSRLCKWGRAGKPHSEKWWGDDTFDSSRTAAVPSSSWWSHPQIDLRQNNVFLPPDENLFSHTAHLHPDEDLPNLYCIKLCVVMATLTCHLFVRQGGDGQSWAKLLL